MYQDRRREKRGEWQLTARRQVGAVLDTAPATLRDWIERGEIDARERPGVTSETSGRTKELEREVGVRQLGKRSSRNSRTRHGSQRRDQTLARISPLTYMLTSSVVEASWRTNS